MHSASTHQPQALDATLTKRGQATIPAAVRRLLGLQPYDRVTFQIDPARKQVTLKPAMTLEDAYGSVEPLGTEGDDFHTISQEAREDHVQRVISDLERL